MLGGTLARLRRDAILAAVQEAGWNLTQAARALGMKGSTLRDRLAAYGIARPTPPARVVHTPVLPPPEHLDRPRCTTFHAWRLVCRARARAGFTCVWYCRHCPAVRRSR